MTVNHSSNVPVWQRDNRTYLIAELSANHGGSIDHAKETIHAMKESGADAVKLQTYTAATLTIDCRRPEFMIGSGTIWEGKNLYDLYEEAIRRGTGNQNSSNWRISWAWIVFQPRSTKRLSTF